MAQVLYRRGARDLFIELQDEFAALDLARGGEERTKRLKVAENVAPIGAANAVGQLNAHAFELGNHREQARIDSIGKLNKSSGCLGTDRAN